MKKNISVTTTKRVCIRLHKRDIIRLLKYDGYDLPENTEVKFRVPSGGDYSGESVDVDGENPIYLRYNEVNIS